MAEWTDEAMLALKYRREAALLRAQARVYRETGDQAGAIELEAAAVDYDADAEQLELLGGDAA